MSKGFELVENRSSKEAIFELVLVLRSEVLADQGSKGSILS